ncbi:MAG: diversity-generating retroelement protein Avd [Chloroflexota bacterium]|nr:diversity-generating retroelement protein Avd [Chloroflexota bacterium]
MSDEMVIFPRTFDLVSWLVPKADGFPKAHRFVITKRLLDALLDFQETIIHANAQRGDARLAHLRDADAHLTILRVCLRYVYLWKWIDSGKYEHVSRMVEEIGRLLGGWIKRSQVK